MLLTLIVIILFALIYWFPIRRWFSGWGTTAEERTRLMAGDAVSVNPTDVGMAAITIDAPPEDIWPWLVQIGYQRGGLYSYDWLDILFGFLDRPSADRILPEFQHLAVGDVIFLGREKLSVAVFEPNRALALSYNGRGIAWVWQFGLYPLDDHRTRLVDRSTERLPKTITAWVAMRVMEPAAFIMTRRMLLGVKDRAERLSAARQSDAASKPRVAA